MIPNTGHSGKSTTRETVKRSGADRGVGEETGRAQKILG